MLSLRKLTSARKIFGEKTKANVGWVELRQQRNPSSNDGFRGDVSVYNKNPYSRSTHPTFLFSIKKEYCDGDISMFSGLVETTGIVEKISEEAGCKKMCIAFSPGIFDDLAIGDSVAVNGVCLTIIEFSIKHFQVTAVPETLRLTNLNDLICGCPVNLERSLKANARIGGHTVQGHVEGTGEIIELKQEGEQALLIKIKTAPEILKYIVPKGYVTLDGMSITVIEVNAEWFSITLIPHTQQVTIAKHYHEGSKVNLETDILGKYVEKFITHIRGS